MSKADAYRSNAAESYDLARKAVCPSDRVLALSSLCC
jgi:hypothetical protein